MPEESISVKFVSKIFEVEQLPFELLLNENLLEAENRIGYVWAWYIILQKFEDTQEEREILQNLMVEIIQKIIKVADIRIVGTTLYKENFEIIFYGAENDTTKIGGEISELPTILEDRKGRFIQFFSKKDENWDRVYVYYENCFERE
jgi:hypothetical protein